MSDAIGFEETVRQMALDVIAERAALLRDAGMRTTVEIKSWSEGESDNAEVRVAFWRAQTLTDVVEDFIIRNGQPVASVDEVRAWLVQSIEASVREQQG